ncbi:hypothetical protein P3T76_014174 [Phytophthora citrophthora]|uniref:Uncharacterized protein n=1 Tax=Phytophthora citrophthora TaxID=4793 RepID=A0AAD9LBJ5_9STRA|nr:hypothetical protein P3T76_014174 [Phytophthora citrophthora]
MAQVMPDKFIGNALMAFAGCFIRQEGTLLTNRCVGDHNVYGDLAGPLAKFVKIGEHQDVAMALIENPQWSFMLYHVGIEMITSKCSRCPAMERVVERVSKCDIRNFVAYAIMRPKTFWIADHVIDQMQLSEANAFQLVAMFIEDRGPVFWKNAIIRLCDRPLPGNCAKLVDLLTRQELMDIAKVVIRANTGHNPVEIRDMMRVASFYIDKLRDEVLLLAQLLVSRSLFQDDVLDVARWNKLHEVLYFDEADLFRRNLLKESLKP